MWTVYVTDKMVIWYITCSHNKQPVHALYFCNFSAAWYLQGLLLLATSCVGAVQTWPQNLIIIAPIESHDPVHIRREAIEQAQALKSFGTTKHYNLPFNYPFIDSHVYIHVLQCLNGLNAVLEE